MEKKTIMIIAGAVAGVTALGAAIWAICAHKHVNASEVAEAVEELVDEATDVVTE